VLDNYGTHTHPRVNAWLAAHPRMQLRFTPTSASWVNLAEVFFAIFTRQAIRRGDYATVDDLVGSVRRYSNAWNERCQPLVWVKAANEILAKALRPHTSGTVAGHPHGPK
jgi:hypothetical protein